MSCTTVRDQLPLFVYGDLAPADAAAVGRHLGECVDCRAEHAGLVQARAALDATPAPEVAVDPARIVGLAATDEVRRDRWRRLAVTCGLAAAVAGLAFLKLEVRAGDGQVVVRWGNPPVELPVAAPSWPRPTPGSNHCSA